MKSLLATTAVLESATGLALLALPSAVATILLGAHLDTPVGLTVARLAGVALLAIATACWFARPDHQSRVVKAVAYAMLVYNCGVSAILVYAGLALQLSGIGLWPAVLVHAAMAAWCIKCLVNREP